MTARVISGLVSREAMLRLKGEVCRLYDEVMAGFTGFARDEDVRTAMGWGGLSLAHLQRHGRGLDLDPILAAVHELLPRAELAPDVSCFRRIVPRTVIRWHTDAEGTNSGQIAPDIWNFWFPLEDVGVEYPGLELIPQSGEKMRKLPRRWGPEAERSAAWVETEFPERKFVRWSPEMEVGDALVFNHWILHRTQPMEEMAGPRIGCEMRFLVPEWNRKPWWRVW